jgi:molecular chaperone Hsp33
MDNTLTTYSRRFTLENLDIRGQVVRLTDVWQRMHADRGYPAPILSFLGELACVAVLIGTGLKQSGRAALQIQRGGQPGAPLAVVDCTDQLALRGMARVDESAPSATFSEWVAGGTLAMTLSHANSAQMYQSIVPISGLTVAECFEHYFDQSEQLPTHLWIAADEHGAGALLLQKLPDADRKDPDGWARMEQLAASVTPRELIAFPAEAMLHRLFNQEDVRLYSAKPITYAGVRDEEKVKAMLRQLGRAELEATLAELGEIVVKDDICNEEYRFDAAAVEALLSEEAGNEH